VSGPSVENITKPSVDKARSHCDINAPGSVTACSIMLAHSNCACASATPDSGTTSSARQRCADHQGAATLGRCITAAGSTRSCCAFGYAARKSSWLAPLRDHQSITTVGTRFMICSRSAMRRATSACSHGGSGASAWRSCQRSSAA
jgi:hypothetical protein